MSSAIHERAAVRLFAACALFVGLFLMHGLTFATAGCHGEAMAMTMAEPSTMSSTTAMSGHASAAGAGHGPAVGAPGHGQAESCVSTPPRIAPVGPLLALSGLAVLVSLIRKPRAATAGSWRSGRAPPSLPGSALLTRVCISRT
jgi:hypothetical protein